MKNIPQIIFGIFCFISFFCSVSAATLDEVSKKLEFIGTYLNHQDFESAQGIRKDIVKDITLESLAKDLNFSDFINLLQVISWEEKDASYYELISLREKYHPEDTTRSSFLDRKGSRDFRNSCISRKITSLDYIDFAHCVLRSQQFTDGNKKRIIRGIINTQYRKVLISKDIQTMSDLAILMTYYIEFDTKFAKRFSSYQKVLGINILKKDKNFVNAYFILISTSENEIERSEWVDKLKINYLGDQLRWESTIVPYIESYN